MEFVKITTIFLLYHNGQSSNHTVPVLLISILLVCSELKKVPFEQGQEENLFKVYG